MESDKRLAALGLVVLATALGWSAPASAAEEPTAPVQPAPDPALAPLVSAGAQEPAPAPVYELPSAPVRPFLRPFPVVRIRGSIAARGVVITLLRVRAPLSARVTVRCTGEGCPIRRRTRRAGRIRALERFLPAGIRIVIRVHRRGFVGKYVRIRIRGGKPPARRDACVLTGSSPPIACPRA